MSRVEASTGTKRCPASFLFRANLPISSLSRSLPSSHLSLIHFPLLPVFLKQPAKHQRRRGAGPVLGGAAASRAGRRAVRGDVVPWRARTACGAQRRGAAASRTWRRPPPGAQPSAGHGEPYALSPSARRAAKRRPPWPGQPLPRAQRGRGRLGLGADGRSSSSSGWLWAGVACFGRPAAAAARLGTWTTGPAVRSYN